MKLISKIVKGNCEVEYSEDKSKTTFTYQIFANLAVIVEFNTDKKSLKLSIKAKSFSRQLMYIIFN